MVLDISLAGLGAVLLATTFSNTITLGSLLVGMALLIVFAWAGIRDRGQKRWRELYDLADAERKEKDEMLADAGLKITEAMAQLAEQREVISKLEALKMPTQVMEVMTRSVKKLNDEAARRQDQVRSEVREALLVHESRAAERHERLLDLIQLIADRLGPDPNGHE